MREYTRRPCKVEDCDGRLKGDGYCRSHLRRFRLYGDPLGAVRSVASRGRRTCAVEGCADVHSEHGYCARHGRRLRVHGDPLKVITSEEASHPSRTPERARDVFLSRFVRQESGCLEWTGARDPKGYGRAQWEDRIQLTHRIAFQILVGPIPRGRNVCHHCDNPPCGEPTHLFIGTQGDNHADMTAKGRGFVPEPGRGESAKHAIFTDAEIIAIRAAFDGGERQIDIARRWQMDKSRVHEIVRRKIWKHLPGGSPVHDG